MKLKISTVIAGFFLTLGGVGFFGVGTATAIATWGQAQAVPNIGVLNAGGSANVLSISCTSSGNCSAGGFYTDAAQVQYAFVADETNGVWGNAQQMAGSLSVRGGAQVNSISCPTAGNCSAVGAYLDSSGNSKAFVVDQSNGTWGQAQEVAGAESTRGNAKLESISCTSPGNCSAGGFFTNNIFAQAFAIDEVGGVWGSVQGIVGTSYGNLLSISCPTAGNCSAGGYTFDGSYNQPIVVDETNGTWGQAQSVPNIAPNNVANSEVLSISCGSPGNCSAGGYYSSSRYRTQAFVDDETNGTWGQAQEAPNTATLNTGGMAQITTVSCASPCNCSAGGMYSDNVGNQQALVIDEINGTWGQAQEVPNIATLNFSNSMVDSISCPTAGNCSAGGFYGDGSRQGQAFVVDQSNGTWGQAQEVSNFGTLNAGGSGQISAISCPSAGICGAGGVFTDGGSQEQAFVVDALTPTPPTSTPPTSTPPTSTPPTSTPPTSTPPTSTPPTSTPPTSMGTTPSTTLGQQVALATTGGNFELQRAIAGGCFALGGLILALSRRRKSRTVGK